MVLGQNRGGGSGDAELDDLRDRDAIESVVTRISVGHKARRHCTADDGEPQSAMSQRLVMARDDPDIERATEPLCSGDVGQFPQTTEQATGHAATDDDLARRFDPDQRAREEWELGHGLARCDHRQLGLAAFGRRDAVACERTGEAARLLGRAQRRAELHEALVEIAGCGGLGQRVHELGGARPEQLAAGGGLDVELDPEHACEHPRDVAVDERHALVIGDRGDRARGVGPDAADRAQLGGGAW